MKKFLFCLGLISTLIFLEIFYINFQLDKRINEIENKQKRNQLTIESLNYISDQTLNGIDQPNFSKLTSVK
jgi:uncharacterized membrane protein YciS (DUF1049 family)